MKGSKNFLKNFILSQIKYIFYNEALYGKSLGYVIQCVLFVTDIGDVLL